jgi:hypothetical protein
MLDETQMAEDEKLFQEMWKTYFKSIAIKERINPKFPSSLGIITPKCPKRRAMKITADTSSDSPLILILPNMKPNATIRKREK